MIAGGILALWGHGYHAYGFSALFKPIAVDLGLSRAETSIPSSIGRLEGGIEAPLTGWITDRFGARWIIIAGVFLISLSLILMYFVNSKWAFYAVWGVMLGTGTNIALTLPIDATISNWFIKKRGLALSIKWVFSGLSGVLVLPLIAWLIQVRDWREACLIGGIVMAVVGLPLAWFAIKPRRPEFYGLLPDGAKLEESEKNDRQKVIERGRQYASEIQEVEFTLRQALKTRAYWLMLLVQMIPSLVAPVMSVHAINFLTDRGIDPVRAAAIMAMMIFFSLPTRFLSGIISDRLRNDQLRFVKMVSYFLQGIGVFIFLLFKDSSFVMVVVYIWFVLYGLGQGFGNTLNPLIRARFFGRKAFGSIHGITQMLSTPIGVIAPTYAGWIYDTTGSYERAFIQFSVLLGIAVVLSFFLLPPKPPAQVEDVRKFV